MPMVSSSPLHLPSRRLGKHGNIKYLIGLFVLLFFNLNAVFIGHHCMYNGEDEASAHNGDGDVEQLEKKIKSLVNELELMKKAQFNQQSDTPSQPITKTWKDWPAVAHEQVGAALVTKGQSFFNNARDLYFKKQHSGGTLMDEFLQVYRSRPDPVNMCGIRINHAMALYLAVKQLKPTLVVESGVNAGVSTYFIRMASSTTKIFAIDPAEKPICAQGKRWIDPSNLTINYTGKNFVDLMDLDWKGMTKKKEVDPESTIVFMDDHLHAFDRIAGIRKFGIRHVLIEDNYKYGEGATRNDRISTPKQMFYGEEWTKEGNWLFNNIVSYAEFPPIIPPIMAKASNETRKEAGGFMVSLDNNRDIVPPILRPDLTSKDMQTYLTIAKTLDINPNLDDKMSYMQFMCYNQFAHLEMLPLPSSLLYL